MFLYKLKDLSLFLLLFFPLYLISAGNQDVDLGCCHVPSLLGSKVISVSGSFLSVSLLYLGSSWRPCSRWGSSSSLPLSTGSGISLLSPHLTSFLICRVVLFLFPFIHAMGKVRLIIRPIYEQVYISQWTLWSMLPWASCSGTLYWRWWESCAARWRTRWMSPWTEILGENFGTIRSRKSCFKYFGEKAPS